MSGIQIMARYLNISKPDLFPSYEYRIFLAIIQIPFQLRTGLRWDTILPVRYLDTRCNMFRVNENGMKK